MGGRSISWELANLDEAIVRAELRLSRLRRLLALANARQQGNDIDRLIERMTLAADHIAHLTARRARLFTKLDDSEG